MIYAIPSYKRAGKQETLEFLLRMGIQPKDIYIFVQTKEDNEAYSKLYKGMCNVIYRPANSVPVARNNILRYFDGRDNILMMDDDVSRFSYGSKGMKFVDVKSGRQFAETIDKMFEVTAILQGCMFGLYPVYNEFFMSDDISTRVTVNTVIGFPAGFPLRFNEKFNAKEDIELCGRILNQGGKIIRFNNISFKAKHRTNAGGAYDTWHSDENTKLSRILSIMYPNVFCVRKDNPQEVRVRLKDKKEKGLVWIKK